MEPLVMNQEYDDYVTGYCKESPQRLDPWFGHLQPELITPAFLSSTNDFSGYGFPETPFNMFQQTQNCEVITSHPEYSGAWRLLRIWVPLRRVCEALDESSLASKPKKRSLTVSPMPAMHNRHLRQQLRNYRLHNLRCAADFGMQPLDLRYAQPLLSGQWKN